MKLKFSTSFFRLFFFFFIGFGTHNFLNLCETLETEPYLSANVGSGTVQELIDWGQYTNFDGVSQQILKGINLKKECLL